VWLASWVNAILIIIDDTWHTIICYAVLRIIIIVIPFSEIVISNIGYVLVGYSLIKIIGAFIHPKLRKWLKDSPQGGEINSFYRERSNSLTLAGFSLAALTLFLTIGTADQSTHYNIIGTILYLSISIVCFIISAYITNFSVTRISSYSATTMEMIGLISVGIALLLFFIENVIDNSNMQNIQAVYWVLFAAAIVIALLEVFFQHKIKFPVKS
jgi:hypothetical protein